MSVILPEVPSDASLLQNLSTVLADYPPCFQPLLRQRLISPLLTHIEHNKVTWLQAPAGSGKSVLIDQLIHALPRGTQSALLSLSAGRMAGDSIRSALLSLFSRFSSMGQSRVRFVIFIDDADELLKGQDLVLEQCLSSLPPQGRLVVASRRALPPLHRGVRADHEQTMQLEDLLFTVDELRAALIQAGKPMSAIALNTLWRFTEGWPGVVALLCASESTDSETGLLRLLQTWFEEELFSTLDPGLLDFALDASTVDPMESSVLDRLRGQSGSDRLLRRLTSEYGLLLRAGSSFPRPLLFILRSVHQRQAALRVREMHGTAVDILLERQEVESALEHAFQMGDRDLLIGLLIEHDQALLRAGRMRPLARWLHVLDSEGRLTNVPRLQLTFAWARLFLDDQQAALRMAQRLREGPMAREFERAIQALELTWSIMRDRVAALPDHTDLWWEEDGSDVFARGIHNCTVALAHLICGGFSQAQEMLEGGEWVRFGPFIERYAASVNAMSGLLTAQPENALKHLRPPHGVECDGFRSRCDNSLVATLKALALYEMGCIDDVLSVLEPHMPLLRHTGLLDHIILAYKLHARILMSRGDSRQAQAFLASLECLGRGGKTDRLVFCARLEEVRCSLIRGDLALSRDQLNALRDNERAAFSRDFCFLPCESDTWELMDARIRLAEGDIATLPETLSQVLDLACAAGRERRALTVRILLAMALDRRGNDHAALCTMEAALHFAESRRLVQAFRDEGRGALALALRVAQTRRQHQTFVQHLVEGSDLKLQEGPPDVAASLTLKELQVLALLASGQSNVALAQRLFVSESTVRTHLRSINAKLNARSRLEALAIARRDGLIAV